jgi:RHS repeat-associated protein
VSLDDAGNEINTGITRNYSSRNLMASVEDWAEDAASAHRLDYTYDGRGIRVSQTETPAYGPFTSATRHFIYTPELKLLTVTPYDQPNLWQPPPSDPQAFHPDQPTSIVWFGDRPVAQFSTNFSGQPPAFYALSSTLFTFTDHLGTPILLTDTTGSVVWRAEYEPFGNIHEMRTGERNDQPLRFPGQELAMTWEGTEENYNIFRWYRSGWGRYTQSDPIGLDGGINLYRYARSNPIVGADPYGLTAGDCQEHAQRCKSIEGADQTHIQGTETSSQQRARSQELCEVGIRLLGPIRRSPRAIRKSPTRAHQMEATMD